MKKTFLLFLLSYTSMSFAQPTQMNVPYGSDPLQKLDYTAAHNPLSPILIMVHGGGWAGGDKSNATFTYVAQLFKDEGYAVVSINYRLSTQPGYPGHPAIPSDVACAVAWTKLNAALMNGDSSKVFMYGQSAGGHLAMMHGLVHPPERLSSCGYTAGLNVAGVIACNPALNFEHINPARHADIKPMVGDSSTYWKSAAPAHNLGNGNDTKFLVQIGLNDLFLGTQQALVFRDSIAKYDYCERFDFLPGHDHNSPLNGLSPADPVFISMRAWADSLFSDQLCAAISAAETFEGSAVKVFPNPVSRHLMIEGLADKSTAEACIYSAMGSKIFSGPVTNTLDLSPLSPGLYWIQIRDGSRLVSREIIKE